MAVHSWARRALTLLIVLCGLALVCAPAALAQDPEEVPTVPAEPPGGGGNPNPDPAPEPPSPSPPPPASPPPPVYTPPPAYTPPVAAPTGPTEAELEAEQRRKEREKARREAERKRKEEARRRREAEQAIRLAIKQEAGEGVGLPGEVGLPPPPEVPVVEVAAAETVTPETVTPEPAAAEIEAAPPAPAAAGTSDDTSLDGAAPILLGLFGLSVVLLGLAALPPWSAHTVLGGLLIRRRLELGLLGTAVLASAAIGLLIAVLAG
jgi:hypothetical protein